MIKSWKPFSSGPLGQFTEEIQIRKRLPDVSPASQAYWNSQTGYFPVTVAAHEETVFQENIAKYPQFETAIDQLHDSTPQSAGALLSIFPEARQIVETEIENMLNNGTSPEDTVAKMADSINKSIEDYNLLNE